MRLCVHTLLILLLSLTLGGCAGTSLSSHLTSKHHVGPDGDVEAVNEATPGQRIDLQRYVVYGKYTVFDFTSESCAACQTLASSWSEWTQLRPDIAIRVVDVDRPTSEFIDWDSPVCKQYHVNSLPSFRIYGPNGKLISAGRAAEDDVLKTMHEDLQ